MFGAQALDLRLRKTWRCYTAKQRPGVTLDPEGRLGRTLIDGTTFVETAGDEKSY